MCQNLLVFLVMLCSSGGFAVGWMDQQINADLEYWREQKISRQSIREGLKSGDEEFFLQVPVALSFRKLNLQT